MISDEELLEAIRECEQGPTSYGTAEKLAHLYALYDRYHGKTANREEMPKREVRMDSGSDFAIASEGKSPDDVMEIFEELMEDVLRQLSPRIYHAVLRRLREL